jgi:hypothetical protein
MKNIFQNISVNRYSIFPLAIGLFQFLGFNFLSIFLFVVGGMIIVSNKFNYFSFKNNMNLCLFILFSIIISIINAAFIIPKSFALVVWGQFFFIAILPYFIGNNLNLFKNLKNIILIIFLLDVGTNLLLLINVNVPWMIMNEVRPDETISRFPGVKGSSLFSSLFSFLMLAIAFDNSQFKLKKNQYLIIILAIVNLVLAGAYRSIIMALALFILRYFRFVRMSKYFILGLLFFIIIIVVIITGLTTEINTSNLFRYQIWIHTVNNVFEKPFLGHGLFYADTKEVSSTFENLSEAGVTESFSLSVAYSFGIPAYFLFLIFTIKTLINSTKIHNYSAQLGIFFGLSVELFFGGSLQNTMAVTIFFISAFLLNKGELIKSLD